MTIVSATTICVLLSVTPVETGAQQSNRRPITLRELLDSVRANHPLIAAAVSRVRAARGTRVTAGVLGNPVLSYQVDETPFPGAAPLAVDREAMTMATLPLEPIYQRGPRVRRANADVAAAVADARAVTQRVLLDAAHAYYRVALAQITVNAARDLTAWLDSLVAYNRARAKEGAAAEADALRSELERDRALADLTMDEAELARANADLLKFFGNVAGTDMRIAVTASPAPLVFPTAQSPKAHLISEALVRHPGVVGAEQRVASASAGVLTERSMLFRQIGATFGIKQSGGTNSMIAGFSVPIPLFDQNRGEVARASAERDAATFELDDAQRRASADVAGALDAARIISDRVTALGQSYLRRADEARRITLGAYREGAVPLLQVLDAARAWGESRVTYYRLLYAQHESVLELSVAVGIDLLSRESPATLPQPR